MTVPKNSSRDIEAIILDGSAIDRAIVLARKRVLERHRRLGIPLVIWRDGQVWTIPADRIDAETSPG